MDAQSKEKQQADFVRFTCCDMNGVARAKVIPRCSYEQLKKPGSIGLPSSLCVISTASIATFYAPVDDKGVPDCDLVPDLDTWHLCQWSGSKSGRKIAQVLCEMKEKDARPTSYGFDPRYTCRRLLERLGNEFGFEVFSAFEYEFIVAKDGKPATSGLHLYSPVIMKTNEEYCFDVCDRMGAAGVLLETMMTEYGDGQLELTMQAAYGVKGPDHAFMFKQCVKETAIDHGMHATFMTNPWYDVVNGGHFNFSLWKNNQNLFTDNSDLDGLSSIAKKWIAGIFEHAAAVMAFACHTNNCYNTFFEGSFAPHNICYAVEHRMSFFRVKRSVSSGTYLEFRSAGAAANPYLVMAAIVAAGMDGLRRKLEPPPSGYNTERQIPRTLKAALDALETDDVMRDMIGEDLIIPYLLSKRAHDLPLTTLEEQYAAYAPVL